MPGELNGRRPAVSVARPEQDDGSLPDAEMLRTSLNANATYSAGTSELFNDAATRDV